MNYMVFSDPSSRVDYDFAAPITLQWPGVDSRLLLDVLRTRALNRLRGISFLGGIDYLFVRSPNGAPGNRRYSRYQHSLGVARLANYYGKLVGLSYHDANIACVAALLHDIGHAPLSHSLEPVFREEYGIDHHQATKQVIRGNSPFGNEVLDVLRAYSVDPEEIISTISGESNAFHSFFSGPINFDTIEGISRSRSYRGRGEAWSSPERVVEAATLRLAAKDVATVDGFWESKDQTYRTVINSRQGVLADNICQEFLRNNLNKFRQSSYFWNETQLFKRMPRLRKVLTSEDFSRDVAEYFDRPIHFKARRFFVDGSASFESRQDSVRYQQTKIDRTLVASAREGVDGTDAIEDLFPYEGN